MTRPLFEHLQSEAAQQAGYAAAHLREAASALERTFSGDPKPSDSMEAIEALSRGIRAAEGNLAWAAFKSSLAVLHHEKERHP